jgi:hypothetical protein
MRVLLIGDSIRLFYQNEVIKQLGEEYEVLAPQENCKFSAYVLNFLRFWLKDFSAPDIIHFNAGLWDTAILYREDGCFCKMNEYINLNLENIDDERELIDKIVSLVGDESIEAEMWPRVNSGESFVLKFYSEKWPAIYYCLEYVREGKNGYVYDYLSKKCINVGDILEGYFGSEN